MDRSIRPLDGPLHGPAVKPLKRGIVGRNGPYRGPAISNYGPRRRPCHGLTIDSLMDQHVNLSRMVLFTVQTFSNRI
jgi:hypothetical protein